MRVRQLQSFFILVILLCLCLSAQAPAQYTPWTTFFSNGIDWSQSGIPGGIPTGTQSGSTITSTGSDQTTAINSALSSCGGSAGAVKYVQLAAGTFQVTKVVPPSYCYLNGMGANSTILSCHGTSGACVAQGNTSNYPNPSNDVTISSGATQGSSSIVVSSATGISVGSYLLITELNDSSIPVTINGSEGACTTCDGGTGYNGTRVAGQIVEVESVSGTSIGISPSLYMTYSLSPHASPFSATKYSGLQNLQLYSNNSGYAQMVVQNECAYCWISGVEWNYVDSDADYADIYWGYRGEIINSYASNAWQHAPGTADSDIDLIDKTSGYLVQNNIIERPHAAIMLEWGAAGNVIGYNYILGAFDQNSYLSFGGEINEHGANPMFNLFEGNSTGGIHMDSVWGSSNNQTLFRNFLRGSTKSCLSLTGRSTVTCSSLDTNGTQPPYPTYNGWWEVQANRALDLDFLSTLVNDVGNVLGSNDMATLGHYNNNSTPLTQTTAANAICGPSPCGAGSRSYDAVAYAYSLGYGETSDDGTGGTTNGAGCGGGIGTGTPANYPCHSIAPYSTLFTHGTYNSPGAKITWAGSLTHTLPASFYLSTEPSWFGSVPWPAIGPDVSGGLSNAYGYAYAIPAEVCYEQVMGGTDGTGSPLTFNASTCYGQSLSPPSGLAAAVH
jgi:hypothetical protein